MSEFKPFPKIPRMRRELVVTEKIDGTNALVWVSDDGTEVKAGSRSRWVTPQADNAGFARWVEENRDELVKLGPGYHYGEFWGRGIQRGYGLDHKRFSLFNVGRWTDENTPACCHVVPVLARGVGERVVEEALNTLREHGSIAAPGFMNPEGVVVYHTAAGTLAKVLMEGDELPKGAVG